jgi:hypothetical protein
MKSYDLVTKTKRDFNNARADYQISQEVVTQAER